MASDIGILERLEAELIDRYSATEDEGLLQDIAELQAEMMSMTRWTVADEAAPAT